MVRAALDVADAEGIEAVSMQRVSKELGYTTMSLYRHVDSKEDLLVLMIDTAMEGDPPGPRADGDWRAGLEEWCHSVLELYRHRPWVVRLSFSGPPGGPNGLRWMESGLRELVGSGLDVGEAVQMLLLLSSALRESVRLETDMADAARTTGNTPVEVERDYSRSLRRVVTEEEFPTIALMLHEQVLEPRPTAQATEGTGEPTHELDFGIRRVLDGIESYVRTSGTIGGA